VNETVARPTLQEMLRDSPPAEWVRDMVEHYWRTGTFRPQDLRRLLGDPTKGVEVRPKNSLASFFATSHGSS
jgi:hypothetical protein